jgi:hypothetical protein
MLKPNLIDGKTVTKLTYQIKRALTEIKEELHEDYAQYVPSLTLPELHQKISKASCHKRLRGIQRKVARAEYNAKASQEKKGIIQCTIPVQNDMGSTHCITNNKSILREFQELAMSLPVNGVEKDNTAVTATGIGFLPIIFDEGEVIYAKCLYSDVINCVHDLATAQDQDPINDGETSIINGTLIKMQCLSIISLKRTLIF